MPARHAAAMPAGSYSAQAGTFLQQRMFSRQLSRLIGQSVAGFRNMIAHSIDQFTATIAMYRVQPASANLPSQQVDQETLAL